MSGRTCIFRAAISVLAAAPASLMAQAVIKNPLTSAQSQVITQWQTPAVNEFPFESSLQLGLAPELGPASFTGLILSDGSTITG
jgi:hypothetical protein